MGSNHRFKRALWLLLAVSMVMAGSAAVHAAELVLPEEELWAEDAAARDNFGESLAFDGETLVVSARGKDSSRGAAYVFAKSGGGHWYEQAILKADTRDVADFFGWRVAVLGDTIAVTAPFFDGPEENSGILYIFEREQDLWVQTAALEPNDGVRHCGFGRALAMTSDTIFVGAQCDKIAPAIGGSVFVFTRTDDGWAQSGLVLPSPPQPAIRFGDSVAVEGDIMAVGATLEYWREGAAGAVYLFKKTSQGWVQTERLHASDPGRSDHFGISVDLSGDTLVVGADKEDGHGYNSGAAYLFVRTPSGWAEATKFAPSDAKQADGFGTAIQIHDGMIAVSRGYDEVHDLEPGVVYLFETVGDQVREVGMVAASDGEILDLFGESLLGKPLILTDSELFVGALYHAHDGRPTGSGAVYVYDVAGLSIPCTITGTNGDDTLVGTSGPDVICGYDGDDVIYGKKGNDILRGGPGDDKLYGGFGFDWLFGGTGDDRLIGGAQGDVARGGGGADVLRGKGGHDWLEGNAGNDRLWGAVGNDTLNGGAGADDCDAGHGTDELISCE